MIRRMMVLAACGLSAGIALSDAHAFELTFTDTGATVHQIPMVPRRYRLFLQQGGIGQPQYLALQAAAESWGNIKGIPFSMVEIGDEIGTAATFGEQSSDGLSRLHMTSGFPPGVQPGVEQKWFWEGNGEIFQSNIWMNQTLSGSSPTSPLDDSFLTLLEAAMHEMGHGLGANHMPNNSMAIMKAAATGSNTMGRFSVEGAPRIMPHADDAAFANFLYGSAAAENPWIIRTLPYRLNNGIKLSHGQTGAPEQITRCRGASFTLRTVIEWLSDSQVTSPLSSLNIRLSSNTTINNNDTLIGWINLNPIQGQFTLHQAITATVPANMALGTYWVGVQLNNAESIGSRLNYKIVVNC